MRKLENDEFRSKSIREQLEDLGRTDWKFYAICPEQYRRFLRSNNLAKYTLVDKLAEKSDVGLNEKNAVVIVRILLDLLVGHATVLYFDSSTICDMSFKKKAWSLNHRENKLKTGKQLKTIKMYATFSTSGIQSMQFLEETSAANIKHFLEQTIIRMIELQADTPIFIFLDNATLHKTNDVAELSQRYDIVFLFNAYKTPRINLVEHLFEILKRPLRLSFNMCPYNAIYSILEQAKKLRRMQIATCLSRQFAGMIEVLTNKKLS